MLLALPVEVLQEIALQIPTAGNKNLRAACKSLALRVDNLVFATVILHTNILHLEDGRRILNTLTTGELVTDWAPCVTTLKVDPTRNTPEAGHEQINDGLGRLLLSALRSMPNIQTVMYVLAILRNMLITSAPTHSWKIRPRYPDWPRTPIATFLNSHHVIFNLEIDVIGPRDVKCSWALGSRLRNLKIQSFYAPLILPTFFAQTTHSVINSHDLGSLHLFVPTEWSPLWATLRAHRIHLREIATSSVTDEFLSYLSSYSGLEHLTLRYPGAESATESDQLADKFFDTALPCHAASLLTLKCRASFEGRWSFGRNNADAISRLYRLSQLHMSVNATDVPYETSTNYSGDNAVERLLQLATESPPLRYLAIFPSDPEYTREFEAFIGDRKHDHNVSGGIIAVLQAFSPRASSPAVVVAGFRRRTYELRRIDGADAAFEYRPAGKEQTETPV